MKERKVCILCNKNRVMNQYYNIDDDKCKECTLIKDGIITFGKFKDISLDNVMNTQRQYFKWCLDNIPNFKEQVKIFLKIK